MVTLQKPGYLTGDENEFEWIRKKYLDCEPKITLHCELKVRSREMLTLTVWNERGTTVLVSGTNPVAKALNRPISREDLQKQLAKTGNTPFHFETISVIMDEDVFIPLKEINELRRRALEEMIQTLSAVPGRTAFVPEPKTQLSLNGKNDVIKEKTFKIAVTTEEQWNSVISFYKEHMALRKQIAGLELHFSLLEKLHRNKHLMKQCMELELPLYLCLPQSGRKKGISYCDYFLNQELLKNFRGYYCGNPDTLGYIRMKLGQEEIPMEDVEILADYSLYTCNAQAVSFLKNCRITGLVGSYELNRHEWEELLCSCTGQNLRTEYLIYGHVPFMQSAGCVKKTFQQCDGKNTITYLTDRMGKRIPVMNFCQICENTVYNSVPLVLLEEMDDISCNDYRISFTVEDGKRTEAVLKSFMFREPLSISEFTKGHYKKGIE
jgi:putative protease